MPGLFIDTHTLAGMRAASDAALDWLCDITSPAATRVHGAVQVAYGTPRLTAVPARVGIPAAAAGQIVAADQLQALQRYAVAFPAGTDVRVEDRLLLTHTDPISNAVQTVECEVLGVAGARSNEMFAEAIAGPLRGPKVAAGSQ